MDTGNLTLHSSYRRVKRWCARSFVSRRHTMLMTLAKIHHPDRGGGQGCVPVRAEGLVDGWLWYATWKEMDTAETVGFHGVEFYSLLLEEHDDREIIATTTIVLKGSWGVREGINR